MLYSRFNRCPNCVLKKQSLLKSKIFWVGVLYFAEGFPLGIFYELLPVHFRQQGVELRHIGCLSLLGLAWTIKFLWAPAIDHFRHHRRWMAAVDLAMGGTMLYLAMQAGLGPGVWLAIGLFTILSATNDVAIDGYTIELLNKNELGVANGVRIGLYRVGMLASGLLLVLSDYIGWRGVYLTAAILLALLASACLKAPREQPYPRKPALSLAQEWNALFRRPYALAAVLAFLLATLALIDDTISARCWRPLPPSFWWIACGMGAALLVASLFARAQAKPARSADITRGPLFGALLEMLQRPYIVPVLIFILIFKLPDTAMGFMIKPFWVDAGFSGTQIGLVSVNIGIGLSILGGLAGGWATDRWGIFSALWILGLFQAASNLGYALVAGVIPLGAQPLPVHQLLMYAASAIESFTGGLSTAAFLAFLMAIVDKKHSATEYALLSSAFALSRSLAGWASGFGAQSMGYAPYFLFTFFLALPAYLLLPWVKKMLRYCEADKD